MISTRKLIRMAKKWQKLAASSRKRISFPRVSPSPIAEKGHFVVYSADKERFVFPLTYLKNNIFRELFSLAAEEFGTPADGPITLPCDAAFMQYAVHLIQRNAAKNLEEVLLTSISCGHFLSSAFLTQDQMDSNGLLPICTF